MWFNKEEWEHRKTQNARMHKHAHILCNGAEYVSAWLRTWEVEEVGSPSVGSSSGGPMWTGQPDLPHGAGPRGRSHLRCKGLWICLLLSSKRPLRGISLANWTRLTILSTRWHSTSNLRCLFCRVSSPSWKRKRTEKCRNSGAGRASAHSQCSQ